jgi:hypothetical protein
MRLTTELYMRKIPLWKIKIAEIKKQHEESLILSALAPLEKENEKLKDTLLKAREFLSNECQCAGIHPNSYNNLIDEIDSRIGESSGD